MMNSNKIVLAILGFSLIGCAAHSGPILPDAEREVSYVGKTQGTASELYNRAMVHFAKAFGDANSAIKMRDPASNQIVAQANVPCNAIRPGIMFSIPYNVSFNLDFQAKDGRYRLLLQNVTMEEEGRIANVGQIVSKDDLAKVKTECLDAVNLALSEDLGKKSATSQSNW